MQWYGVFFLGFRVKADLSLQAQAMSISTGSTSLPADIARRAALLLNPNVQQLSPLAQDLLVRKLLMLGRINL